MPLAYSVLEYFGKHCGQVVDTLYCYVLFLESCYPTLDHAQFSVHNRTYVVKEKV